MSESILRDKAKEFAKQIVLLCRDLKSTAKETVLSNQLLRSGTSIGANIHEAQYAQGNRHFWAEGYYVSTVGLNESTIRKYIEDQEKHDIAGRQVECERIRRPF